MKIARVEVFQIDLPVRGGVTPMIRQRAIAAAAGLTMSIQDTVGSEISFAALLQIAQSKPRRLLRCALGAPIATYGA